MEGAAGGGEVAERAGGEVGGDEEELEGEVGEVVIRGGGGLHLFWGGRLGLGT